MSLKHLNAARLVAVFALALSLSGLFGHVDAYAEDVTASAEQSYKLPAHGYFNMNVPAGWNVHADRPAKTAPPTLNISPAQGERFAVTVTPIWQKSGKAALTKEMLRKRVEYAAGGIGAFAVEKHINIVEFDGAPGYYFTATDRAPKRGGYKFLTKGWINVDDLTVSFTALTNKGQDAVIANVLNMLKSASHRK